MPDAVVLTPSASGQTGVANGHYLVSLVARIAGGEDEPALRVQALDCLNRARIELNQYDWRFAKTTAPTITLVTGTRTYLLPSTFKKPSYARLINADGTSFRVLEYNDDSEAWRIDERQDTSGEPSWYKLRNEFEDGLIDVCPTPDATSASTHRLVVEYFQRYGAFSDSDIRLSMPEEAQNCLVLGGQAWLLRERIKNSPMTTQAFADFQRALTLLKTADRRITDEQPRFNLKQLRTKFDPTIYVKWR